MSALLAALFVRSLVPEGFMPAAGEMVELCTMHGPRMVIADPETGEILQVEDEQAAPACPWWLATSSLAGPSLLGLHFPLATPNTTDRVTVRLPNGRASLALPPARAPPALLIA